MKNTQSGLFFLLAVLCFCKSRLAGRAGGPPGRAGFYYGLTLAFAALALASKSSTVILPFVLGLCAWWLDRGWSWRRNLLALAPLVVLSILTGVVTIWTQKAEGAFDPEFALDFHARLAVAGKVVWFYLGKLAWPHPLIFIYPRWQIDPAEWAVYLPAVALAASLIGLWWQRNRGARPVFFAMAFFVAALVPVLGLVDTYFWRYAFVGDHFQYLASMGPLALGAAGLHAALGGGGKSRRWLGAGVGGLLVVTLGILTWRQCARYQNDEVLWTATLRDNPSSWIAHNNLGTELDRHPDRIAEAIAHFEEAVRLRPQHARAHYNLARALAKCPGRQDAAIAQYEAALRIDPGLGWAHQNLAVLLAARPGRQAEVIAHHEAALRLLPESAETHFNLATELARTAGRQPEAVLHFRAALRLQPDFARAHNNLALVLAAEPDGAAEAAAHFEAALRIRPDWDEAHNNYASLLASLPGRMPEAIAHYEAALRIRPEAALVHANLAGAYYRSGRLAEAISQLELALQLNPGDENARHNLAVLRQELAR
jgi:tetratricopeptide (TPR) repeat protein